MSDVVSCSVYHSTLQTLWVCASLQSNALCRAASSHLDSFVMACIETLQQCDREQNGVTPQKALCLPILSLLLRNMTRCSQSLECNTTCSPAVTASVLRYTGSLDLSLVFQKATISTDPGVEVQAGRDFQWGRLLANHVASVWNCLEALFTVSTSGGMQGQTEQLDSQLSSSRNLVVVDDPVATLDVSLTALECVKGPAVVAVIRVLELLIPKASTEIKQTFFNLKLTFCLLLNVDAEIICMRFVRCLGYLCWQMWKDHSSKCVQALLAARNASLENWRDHTSFWPVLDAYVKLAFQPFLLLQPAQSCVHETLQEVRDNLLVICVSKYRLVCS